MLNYASMNKPDSDYRYHPSEQQAQKQFVEGLAFKPKYRRLDDMVSEGTIGEALIASIQELGERERPETIFNQPLASLWSPKGKATIELARKNITTVADILELTPDEFSSLANKKELLKKLENYFERITITPHARLAKVVRGDRDFLTVIPPNRETELREAVETLLRKSLGEKEMQVLKLRFGLDDGIPRSLGETAKELDSIGIEQVRNAHARAINKCYRHPSRKILNENTPLPQDSLGRTILEAVFWKDLPPFLKNFRISELSLSWRVLEELRSQHPFYTHTTSNFDFRFFFEENLEGLSEKAKAEIVSSLQRFIQEKQAAEAE